MENLEKNSKEGIGDIYVSNFSNMEIKANETNLIDEITLPVERYILVGCAYYKG